MSSHFPHPVIISGAGPAGLLLGHALKRAGIAFKIYERDVSLTKRSQGYRFKIHNEGVLAVSETLSSSHFNLVRQSCGKHFPSFGAHLDALTAATTPGAPPPMDTQIEPLTADRSTFRSALARGLENEIHFGRDIVGFVETVDADKVSVRFADGHVELASLLVAADGAWSKIRQQKLPNLTPLDTECRAFYGKTPITPEFKETFNKAALQGMSLVVDRTQEYPTSLLLEPMIFDHTVTEAYPDLALPQDYVYWVLGSRVDHLESLGWKDSRVPASAEECVSFLKKITDGWHSSVKPLFDTQSVPQTSVIRIGSMPPELIPWDSSRVTLIGDAAHLMSPTAGLGASSALRDAALLGKLLGEVHSSEGVVDAVAAYESAMKEYVKKSITWSTGPGKKLFGMKDIPEWKPFTM